MDKLANPQKVVCQQCRGIGAYETTLKDRGGRLPHGLGVEHWVPCDLCNDGYVDLADYYARIGCQVGDV